MEDFKVIFVGKNPDASVLDFVLAYEKYCVSLAERILHHDADIFCILDGKNRLTGVFSYSSGGQILHCLPTIFLAGQGDDEGGAQKLFSSLKNHFEKFNLKKLFSVIGEAKSTDFVLKAIFSAVKKLPLSITNFLLMEYLEDFQKKEIQKNDDENLQIFRCSPQMLQTLLPMQEAYEREEVLAAGQEYNEFLSSFMLKRALRLQNVYVLASGKVIVSKATFNAVSNSFAQLGGMYTAPRFRRNGYASRLVNFLVAQKKLEGKKVVLFVKNSNSIARSLYENCGFTPFSGFKICYY
ncbi:GNAT family N-acetyltransferase [Treponema zioleckii]|uniref:GNAT family N-acetyltransferase n=1 Tax=Treponema zioleckii TaxID=331680 RepID=UPI00168BCECF|nr:GNAT family N-acetyltransferase [Treponema zioleckii]